MESENKNLYLMTGDKSDLISISTETINDLFSCYGDNIKSDSITAKIFIQNKLNGVFEVSETQKMNGAIQDSHYICSKTLQINNWKSKNENDGFRDVCSIKIFFQAEKTNGEKLSFEIMVRKNKHEDIIIEKLNPETNEFDLVKSKVALGGFGNGIVYVITDIINNLNYKSRRYSTFLYKYKDYLDEKHSIQNDILVQNSDIDTRHRVQYNGSDVYRCDLIRRSAMNSVATQDRADIRNIVTQNSDIDTISRNRYNRANRSQYDLIRRRAMNSVATQGSADIRNIVTQNSGIDTRHRVQYNGSDVYRYDLIRRRAMNSVATQGSADIRNKKSSGEILDLISNHIGKIIIFLLSLVILGIVWYLNLVSLQIGLTALAVCLALFVGIAIWDQKKKRLPKPKKIWTGFCSYLGFACCKQKEGGRVPLREMDRNKNRF